MSFAKLNLFIRGTDCNLLMDAWRVDLVIQSCNGNYMAIQDQECIAKLQAAYPNYNISLLPNYMSHDRISIKRTNATDFINHIEMDFIPGTWKIWARICHGKNEETNKIMVIAHCGDEICANLLLNAPAICSNNDVFPIGINAIQHNMPDPEMKQFLMVMKEVAQVKRDDLEAWVNDRIAELNDTTAFPPTGLLSDNERLRTLIQQLPPDIIY